MNHKKFADAISFRSATYAACGAADSWLRYWTTSTIVISAIVLSIPGKTWADPIFWPENGNHYDSMIGNLTWFEARDAAAASSLMGVPGHLATITSSEENAFLLSNFGTGVGANFAWVGGREPDDDGIWLWDVGPEAGIQFSNFGTPTPPFNYANWGGIEPNDDKPQEDYLMFNVGQSFAGIAPGEWADAEPTPSTSDPVIGYLVEFETVPEPQCLVLLGLAIFAAPRFSRNS